jgi:hypothetical protein
MVATHDSTQTKSTSVSDQRTENSVNISHFYVHDATK